MALAQLSDVEAVSRLVPDEDQARVQRLIEMVSSAVQGYTGQSFDEVTETVTVWPHDGAVRLSRRPVTEVTSITQSGAVLDPSTYVVNANGVLTRAVSYFMDSGRCLLWGTAPLTVEYTAGYPEGEIPADIAMVVAETVADRWNAADQNPYGYSSYGETVAGYSDQIGFRDPGSIAWSPTHKAILDRYRRSGLASLRLTS